MDVGQVATLSQTMQGLTQVSGGVAAYLQANDNARALRRIGRINASDRRREVRAVIGAQRASQAASGIELSSGSALDLRAMTAGEGELDALRLRFGARAAASVQEARGRSALASAATSGVNTILGGFMRKFGQAPPEVDDA